MEEEVSLLVEAGRKMGARNWVPATSGNLSVRREGTPTRYLISASGGSKSELTTEDFLLFEVGAPAARRAGCEVVCGDRGA